MPRAQIAFVVTVAVLLVITGCSGATPTLPTVTPADTPQSPAATLTPAPPAGAEPPGTSSIGEYPGPTMTARPGYPGPAEAVNQELPVTDYTPQAPTAPAPTERQGVVTGTLTRDIRGTPLQPIAGSTLHLAEILRDTTGKLAGLASLDEETAPTTVTDAEGRFAFTEVEPGLYILIVKTPISLVPVRSAGEEDVAAEVSAGKVTELGIIHSTITW
jgi:hypothetical protein